MTKRDITVWFCKVAALLGALQAVFSLVQWGLIQLLVNWSMTIGFGYNILRPVLWLGFYLFVWFFAVGIGESILSASEKDEVLTRKTLSATLLLRCVGLWLLLWNALSFSTTLPPYLYEKFFSNAALPAGARLSLPSDGFTMASLIANFGGIGLGFLLAFMPKIRAFLRR